MYVYIYIALSIYILSLLSTQFVLIKHKFIIHIFICVCWWVGVCVCVFFLLGILVCDLVMYIFICCLAWCGFKIVNVGGGGVGWLLWHYFLVCFLYIFCAAGCRMYSTLMCAKKEHKITLDCCWPHKFKSVSDVWFPCV